MPVRIRLSLSVLCVFDTACETEGFWNSFEVDVQTIVRTRSCFDKCWISHYVRTIDKRIYKSVQNTFTGARYEISEHNESVYLFIYFSFTRAFYIASSKVRPLYIWAMILRWVFLKRKEREKQNCALCSYIPFVVASFCFTPQNIQTYIIDRRPIERTNFKCSYFRNLFHTVSSLWYTTDDISFTLTIVRTTFLRAAGSNKTRLLLPSLLKKKERISPLRSKNSPGKSITSDL